MAAPWFRRTETIVSESSGVVNWRKKRLQAAPKNPGSRVIYFRFSRYSNANPLRVMSWSKRQHRTMGAAGFGGSFAQSCSMKNGKYIQYSHIFHTFACVKISRRISLPHYAVLPYDLSEYASPTAALCGLEVLQTFSTLLDEEIVHNSCKNCLLMVY